MNTNDICQLVITTDPIILEIVIFVLGMFMGMAICHFWWTLFGFRRYLKKSAKFCTAILSEEQAKALNKEPEGK